MPDGAAVLDDLRGPWPHAGHDRSGGARPVASAEGPVTLYHGIDPSASSLHIGNFVGVRHASSLPGRRPSTHRARRRGHRHDRRSRWALRGAQPARRGRRSRPTSPASGASSSVSSISIGPSWSTTSTGPATSVSSTSSATSASTSRSTRWSPRTRFAPAWRASTASRSPSSATSCSRPTTTGGCTTHHGCELQIGGSDQWGNIVAGIDLVRRRSGATVHGADLAPHHPCRRPEVRQVRRRGRLARPGAHPALRVPPVLAPHRRSRRRAVPPAVDAARRRAR